jgi:hypothetical protein
LGEHKRLISRLVSDHSFQLIGSCLVVGADVGGAAAAISFRARSSVAALVRLVASRP